MQETICISIVPQTHLGLPEAKPLVPTGRLSTPGPRAPCVWSPKMWSPQNTLYYTMHAPSDFIFCPMLLCIALDRKRQFSSTAEICCVVWRTCDPMLKFDLRWSQYRLDVAPVVRMLWWQCLLLSSNIIIGLMLALGY